MRCELSSGTVGWGEGLPRYYVTGETIETVWEQWLKTDWRSQLGDVISDWDQLLEMCQSLQLASLEEVQPPASNDRDCFGNSLRSAVELALLDAAGQQWKKPLSAVVEMLPETVPIREFKPSVQYGVAIMSRSRRKQVLHSLLYRLYGFKQAKIKVGTQGIDDVQVIKTVRKWMGTNVDLRIDANEAWSPEEVIGKLEPLIAFGLSSVEQPVPHQQVKQLEQIKSEVPLPIMLDESLCSLTDARKAIDRQWCDLFNIRISKCGGWLNSLKIAALAHQSGMGYQLGALVGETGILSAAGRHFACAVANISSLEGSYDRFLVREPLVRQDLTFGYGGRAPALTGNGLGIDVDEDAVKRVIVNQADWN